MTEPVKVEPGQLWIDNDKRVTPTRYVRILKIVEGSAVVATWYDKVGDQARYGTIRLDRFRPTSTGYRLAENQDVAS